MSDFARKTGDYQSLSAVDIRVIALAYQLTKEYVGIDGLKKQPETKVCQSNCDFYFCDGTSARTLSEEIGVLISITGLL